MLFELFHKNTFKSKYAALEYNIMQDQFVRLHYAALHTKALKQAMVIHDGYDFKIFPKSKYI